MNLSKLECATVILVNLSCDTKLILCYVVSHCNDHGFMKLDIASCNFELVVQCHLG